MRGEGEPGNEARKTPGEVVSVWLAIKGLILHSLTICSLTFTHHPSLLSNCRTQKMADELGYHTAEEIAKLKVFPEEIAALPVFSNTVKTDGPASSEGYVYYITDDMNNFKVGRSVDPYRRLRDLQTGNPNELKIITKKVSDMAECEKRLLEKMEKRFESTGGGTEWFTGDVKKARRVFHDVAGRFK